jgi:hypothetical protein
VPFTAEQMAFVNDTVTTDSICGGEIANGWYSRLYYSNARATEVDPVVADVHTQPTDEGGAEVGRILHVGVGLPRQMVVTVQTCTGPRAYIGLASRYHERITQNWERMNDDSWKDEVMARHLTDVEFVGGL